jgi:hypothetical protein
MTPWAFAKAGEAEADVSGGVPRSSAAVERAGR